MNHVQIDPSSRLFSDDFLTRPPVASPALAPETARATIALYAEIWRAIYADHDLYAAVITTGVGLDGLGMREDLLERVVEAVNSRRGAR